MAKCSTTNAAMFTRNIHNVLTVTAMSQELVNFREMLQCAERCNVPGKRSNVRATRSVPVNLANVNF